MSTTRSIRLGQLAALAAGTTMSGLPAICASALLLSFGSPASAQSNTLRDVYFGETHCSAACAIDAFFSVTSLLPSPRSWAVP